jgi:hypothetical protein
MKYKITIYERASTSDGAGGRIPGSLSLVTTTWGKVKSLSGFIGMTFQNINGTQGYEVTFDKIASTDESDIDRVVTELSWYILEDEGYIS